jgi:predicted helicase
VKELAQVFYYDLWGCREEKYNFLESTSLDNVNWIEVKPTAPNYFFAPKNFDLATEYNQGWSVTDIFPVNSTGVKTHRDHFVIDFDLQQLRKRIEDFRNLDITDDKLVNIYDLRDTRDWKISIKRKLLSSNLDWMNYFTTCFYRPFDTRFYYHHQDVVELTRNEIMQNVNKLNNIGLILCRQQSQSGEWSLVSVSDQIIECCAISNKTRETNYLFLLYTYPNTDNDQTNLFVEKTPNLSTQFLEAIKNKLGKTPTPEQIFYYAYAIFHSPTYRSRYAEFLKIDFPRLPLTSNQNLFNALANKGEALVNLHLMKSDLLNNLITTYQEIGDHQITEVIYNSELQRVYINKQNYFTNIPQHIWEFKIGGYQVLDKWLKDRKNAKRKLSNDEIIHYQKIVVVLTETLRIMEDIDQIIPGFPIE